MKKVRIAARLAGARPAAPDVIADYACDGSAMLGVIRIAAGSSDHHWERHDCGDEVLYLLAGRALFTAVGTAGTDEVLVEAGVRPNSRTVARPAERMSQIEKTHRLAGAPLPARLHTAYDATLTRARASIERTLISTAWGSEPSSPGARCGQRPACSASTAAPGWRCMT